MKESIKFWVGYENEEYSRKVQEYLFTQGVKWRDSKDTVVRYTECSYIFANMKKELTCGSLKALEFKNSPFKEVKLVETVSYSLEEVKETVSIRGVEYNVDDVLKALEDAKEVKGKICISGEFFYITPCEEPKTIKPI